MIYKMHTLIQKHKLTVVEICVQLEREGLLLGTL